MTNAPLPTTNWANSYRYGFQDWLLPETIEELQSAVAAHPRIKVLGSRHSFNGIVDGTVALLPHRIPLAPVIGSDGKSVSIAGHATYGELALFLGSNGLAVHNLASLPHISIAGAIATATHGSGRLNGNLATAVSSLDFVTADGSIVTTGRGDADFDGMVVHLGALGVVSRVTLDVEPAFDVAQSVYEGLAWSALTDNLDDIMSAGYSVSVFTDWRSPTAQVWIKQRTDAGKPPETLFGALPAAAKRHPIPSMDATNTTEQLGAPGLWSDRLPHFKMGFTPSNGDEIQSEFHVPFHNGATAIAALHAIRDSFAPLVQTTEFRAVAADRLWLSPQYGRDMLSIHFTWVPDTEGVNAAAARVETALAGLDALPHWGKVFTPGDIGARYARRATFKAIRDRMDPGGKFSNPWLEQIVLGSA